MVIMVHIIFELFNRNSRISQPSTFCFRQRCSVEQEQEVHSTCVALGSPLLLSLPLTLWTEHVHTYPRVLALFRKAKSQWDLQSPRLRHVTWEQKHSAITQTFDFCLLLFSESVIPSSLSLSLSLSSHLTCRSERPTLLASSALRRMVM